MENGKKPPLTPIRTLASTSMPAKLWSRESRLRRRQPPGPGTEAALGGFGGLFDIKAAGFKDPLLVAP